MTTISVQTLFTIPHLTLVMRDDLLISRPAKYVCRVLVGVLLSITAVAQQPASREPASTPPQVKRVLPSYEGQNVSSVELAGAPGIRTSDLEQYLAQKEGQPFSKQKVDQSIAALKASGRFKDVQLQVVPDLNGVRVLLIVQPGIYFGIFEFPGAVDRFSYSRLLQATNYPPEGPYADRDVQQNRESLEKFFQRSGYFLARVDPEVKVDKQHGLANVFFNTTLGKRAKFGEVTIKGTTPEEAEHLLDVQKSFWARLHGASIRKGKNFSPSTLRKSSDYLENKLIKENHLNADVKLIGANYDPESNLADIGYQVNPGPVIHVNIEGAHVWSWTKHKLLPIYQQVGVDPEIIQEGRQNLISHFQSKGYFEVKVETNVQKKPNGEDIVYQVTKGPRHKVAEVEVAGNKTIGDAELDPHVEVEEAHFFGHGKYSEKLVKKTVDNLENIYHAKGFSDVKINPDVKENDGSLKVTFHITEGPRNIVQSLNVVGNDTMPVSQLAPKGLKVAAGQPYSQTLVDEDRNQIMAEYLRSGYLTATFRATVKPLEKNSHQVQVVYQIYEGPQVITKNVVTLGAHDTRQGYINLITNLPTNKPLSEGEMLTAESQLFTPGIFDWARVDPRRQITTQKHEDVVIKVHEAKQNTITYGFGFEVINRGGSVPSGTVAVPGLPPVGLNKDFQTSEKTFWGPRGTLEYTRRNLRGRAEAITLTGFAGRLAQRGSFTYLDPHFRSSSWAANLTASGEHNSENPIFTSRQGETGLQFEKNLNAKKTQNLFLRYNFRKTGLTRLLIPDLVPAEDQHVRLSTLSATYVRDTRDNILDAKNGIYQSYEFSVNPSAFGSSVNYGRFLGQTAYYFEIPFQIVWANSIRLGLQQPWNSHVPVSEKFFSGGGSTLRGFPLNGAGPQKTISACGSSGCFPITVPVGGNELFIVNSEFRIPVPIKKGLGVVGFYDGGNVFPTIGFHGQYTNTIGGGIRYATPVGPVRIDIGHNLNAPPGIKSTQIFITLGQSF